MAGSTRNKSDGSGYQREGLKSDYSTRARDSFDKMVAGNQRSIGYTPKGDREQSVNRAAKGSRLAGPKSGTMTSWMGGFTKKTITPRVAPPKPTPRPSVRKPTEITIPGGGLRSSAAKSAGSSKPKSNAMAPNPRTGSTLGFTTGKTTGSTATKSGVAGKSTMSASQRAAQNAMNKGGVAGPTKNAAGKNASSMTGKRK